MEELNFYITEYSDENLEIECKHMHYDNFPKEELFYRMTEIQEHCDGIGVTPIFKIM